MTKLTQSIWPIVIACVAVITIPAVAPGEDNPSKGEVSDIMHGNRGSGEVLYNGIELPEEWPPRDRIWSMEPIGPPPYIVSPPKVIPIDVGRQLFVDDFLIEETSLERTFHAAEYYPGNPVFDSFPYSDGLWYDPQDNLFKMWYWNRLAISKDGINWEKPSLDVVPGTNIVFTEPEASKRDSATVWLDLDETDPSRRYKMFVYVKDDSAHVSVHFSPDGIHWSESVARSGMSGDTTGVFRNPFRNVWVYSVKDSHVEGRADTVLIETGTLKGRLQRVKRRLYWEARDLIKDSHWHMTDWDLKWSATRSFPSGFAAEGSRLDTLTVHPDLNGPKKNTAEGSRALGTAVFIPQQTGQFPDENYWENALVLPQLVDSSGETKAGISTDIRFLRDERYLYARVVCHGADPLTDRAKGKVLWQRDHIELFLKPNIQQEGVLQVGLARNGEMKVVNLVNSREHDVEWDTQTEEVAGGWQGMLRIPITDVERLLEVDSTPAWGVMVGRADLRFHEDADKKIPYWIGADGLDDRVDPPWPALNIPTMLYRLDCVAYESLILGLFNIWHGQHEGRPKINDLVAGFSRDGFHWDRTNRKPLVSVSETEGDWNWGNVSPVGGCCLIVGDKLYFYVAGRSGSPNPPHEGKISTGIATLRRDGFASMDAGDSGGTLTTRTITFKGKHLFVNIDAPDGELRVEVLDTDGEVIHPFTTENCRPVSDNKTLYGVTWNEVEDLSSLIGEPVKFRFHLENGKLYSFWVSPDTSGASYGYVAAGGPGFTGHRDTPGRK